MTPLTIDELTTLQAIYTASRQRLIDTIINSKSVGLKTYYNEILRSLQREITTIQEASATFALKAVPREYSEGLQSVYNYFKRNNLRMKRPDMFAVVNYQAVYALVRDYQHNIQSGTAQVGRQVMRYINTARDDALRKAGLSAAAEKIAGGQTLSDMRANLVDKLQTQGFMSVQYGEGANAFNVSLESYAVMVARSTTAEATNLARENQLTENGYDLVEMTVHYPTCNICAQYQGRVYSISGEDKRFPALMETAFSSGYRNVHPNCRHAIVPFIEELKTDDEMSEALAKAGQPFLDERTEAQKEAYDKTQRMKRELRQDIRAYEKLQLETDKGEKLMSFHRFRKSRGHL